MTFNRVLAFDTVITDRGIRPHYMLELKNFKNKILKEKGLDWWNKNGIDVSHVAYKKDYSKVLVLLYGKTSLLNEFCTECKMIPCDETEASKCMQDSDWHCECRDKTIKQIVCKRAGECCKGCEMNP